MKQKRKDEKKKKKSKDLDSMILQIMEKSVKQALDQALDDIFKSWK